jgi:hypothetical protein
MPMGDTADQVHRELLQFLFLLADDTCTGRRNTMAKNSVSPIKTEDARIDEIV